MTLSPVNEAGAPKGPPQPSNAPRYAILGRWISIIARHETLVTSDALAVAVAMAELIGDGWDRWHRFDYGKIIKRLNCDDHVVWDALKRLEECNAVTVNWTGNRGNELQAPYVLLAFGNAAKAAEKK